ncbi:MAG: hypothetical protein ACTH8P_01310 [Ewingella sp.]|uniref:hypothetical protein n=1 Tax=Ewingella sp. TaxID=1897459 RepID=UPI003F91916B
MAKSAAERKAAQRARQSEAGVQKVEVALDRQEVEMLRENCALRRPARDPYDMDEYITMLIRKDNSELKAQLAEQAKRTCKKCGDALPGDKQRCAFVGEGACWQTMGWHETKLTA